MILKVRFRIIDGYLELRPVSGLPITDELYYVSRMGRKKIHSMDDLQAHVVIDSEEGAIDFVRLRTSPSTYQSLTLLPKNKMVLEIINSESVDDVLTFGDKNLAKDIKKYNNGYLGITPKVVLDKIRFFSLKIKKSGNVFIVKRFIIRELDIYKVSCCIISETVKRNGDYKWNIEKNIKYIYRGWRFPYYE